MHHDWSLIRDLGDSAFLVTVFVGIIASLLANRESRLAARWIVALGVAVGAVVATKIAFFGWGVGIRALDFTAVSGHATLSAAIYPVLGRMSCVGLGPLIARRAAIAGAVLAVAIGIASVITGAHSPAEVVAGLALGGLVATFALAEPSPPLRSLVATAMILVCMVAAGVNAYGHRANATERLMFIAARMAGHAHPYNRESWLNQGAGG